MKIRSVVSLTKTSCFVISQQEISHFDDFILNTRVFYERLKILFLFAYFYEHRLSRHKNFTLWRFYLTIRVFRRAIFAEFDRITVNFANFVREICCAKDSKSSSLLINEVVLKTTSSQIERSCFFLLADFASVNFTSLVSMKIKYNVRKRVWLDVTITETWIFNLKSKYVHERSKYLK